MVVCILMKITFLCGSLFFNNICTRLVLEIATQKKSILDCLYNVQLVMDYIHCTGLVLVPITTYINMFLLVQRSKSRQTVYKGGRL